MSASWAPFFGSETLRGGERRAPFRARCNSAHMNPRAKLNRHDPSRRSHFALRVYLFFLSPLRPRPGPADTGAGGGGEAHTCSSLDRDHPTDLVFLLFVDLLIDEEGGKNRAALVSAARGWLARRCCARSDSSLSAAAVACSLLRSAQHLAA